MNKKYVLAIDQGTSSTKTILFNEEGQPVARGWEALHTSYSADGFVEQDPEEIYQNVLASVRGCLERFTAGGGDLTQIVSCGISNQRETFVIWEESSQPLYDAVVWQCKRSAGICARWKQDGLESMVRERTGLIPDPYFSGSKLAWLNENVPDVRNAIKDAKAFFGTVDTWLLYKLTGGRNYKTDYTNASRTLFFNLDQLSWDEQILDAFGLTGIKLPEIHPSAASFGRTSFEGLLPAEIEITAMIGDSHAAAFGEGCFDTGTAKATLGTGCSILMNVGSNRKDSSNGMMSTICWSTENEVAYALEGVIVSCGATIEWLKNDLGLFTDSKATQAMAESVPDNGGVYLIPAFSGLGAPHWDMNRKASICGLTFGTNKNHVVRAALESIPYQIKDVIVAMEADTGIDLQQLMTDGGITSNGFVLQFLSDLLEKPVTNIGQADVSALGAAYLAGLKCGIFSNLEHLKTLQQQNKTIRPGQASQQVKRFYEGWLEKVSQTELIAEA